jgi:putative FmdB family regulatory protein
MPVYEYSCPKCGEKKEVMASVAEREKSLTVTCPKCVNENMIEHFGFFHVRGLPKRMRGPSSCCG